LRPDQIVLAEVIHLDPLRLRIDKAARRSADDAGRVEVVDEARQQLAAAG